MAVPYTFGTATAAIPLSQLDTNFATAITIGNTAVQLGNTVTTLNNMTLANVTISSGNVTITNVSVTTANVSGTANVQTLVVTANASVAGNVTVTGNVSMNVGTITTANVTTANIATSIITSGETLSYGTANGVAYLNGSKVLTTGSALKFDGTALAIGSVTPSTWMLDVKSAGTGVVTNGIRFNRSSVTTQYGVLNYEGGSFNNVVVNTAGSGCFWGVLYSTDGSTTTQPLALDASGNLAVGNTSSLSSAAGRIDVTINGTSSSMVSWGTGGTRRGYALHDGTDFTIANESAGNLRWLVNGSERARIDSSGNLLVGATSNAITAARLLVQTASDYQLTINASTASGTVYSAINFAQAGAGKSAIFQDHANTRLYAINNGTGGVYLTAGATSWTAVSDERIKDIIEPIADAANKVSTLRAVIGKYKTDEEGTRRSFLIAQDVQAVLPEAVTSGTLSRSEDTTEYLGVAYTDVIPLLVAAIKEQQSIINTLTDRISALEQK